MSKPSYNIHLKGYVGGADFDRNAVDSMLADNSGKQVNVLIDSLGGSLATGLSISAAFKQHGDVSVHFVGLNASAATIASLGAKHISMDAGAMYLVHQCSMAFFEWGSLNSDQFATLIADCEKTKADLDKLDLNVAQLYARKCRKPCADLLALMKVGGWLSAQEALDWGFVDEITDLADEPAPKLTDKLATAMASEGMPIPNIPLADPDREGLFAKFLQAITSLFKSPTNTISTVMNKTYASLCALLGLSAIALTDNAATLTDEQLTNIDNSLKSKDDAIAAHEATIAAHLATISANEQTIADSLVGKGLAEHLNDALWGGKRNAAGDTTADLFDGFDTITENEIAAGKISEDLGNYLKLEEEITSANAVDVAKRILFSLDPRLRKEDLYMFCSQDFADKYNEAYLMSHGGINYNTQYDQTAVEGSNGRLKLVPLYNKMDSKFIHICPKSNMLVGYDQMGDVENILVKEYEPFILSYIATMFFGVQFESIDKRRFKAIELA